MLRVDLAAIAQDHLDDLLDEYRAEADAAVGDARDIVAWLAERGVPAELVPLQPGSLLL